MFTEFGIGKKGNEWVIKGIFSEGILPRGARKAAKSDEPIRADELHLLEVYKDGDEYKVRKKISLDLREKRIKRGMRKKKLGEKWLSFIIGYTDGIVHASRLKEANAHAILKGMTTELLIGNIEQAYSIMDIANIKSSSYREYDRDTILEYGTELLKELKNG